MINVKIECYQISNIPLVKEDPAAWWDRFSAVWPHAHSTPDFSSPTWHYSIMDGPARITEEEATELMALGVDIKLVPLPGAMLVKMQDRHKWEHGVNHEHLKSGAAVQLAIPDLGLLRINEVVVREDYCTDALQTDLDEGWRILAVCPPNAARRPDYVLGRTK